MYTLKGEGEGCVHVGGRLCPIRTGKIMSDKERKVYVRQGGGRLCPIWRGRIMSTLEKETAMSDKEREGYVQTGEEVGVRSARKTRMR